MCPFPEWDGESIRTGSLLRALARDHHVTLLTRTRDDVEQKALEAERSLFCRVLAFRFPHNSRAAIVRKALSPRWWRCPLRVSAFCFDEIGRALAHELASGRYDGLVLDHLALAHYLSYVPPSFGGIRVLNVHNVESVLQRRMAPLVRPAAARPLVRIEAMRMHGFETRALAQLDGVLSPTPHDSAIISERAPRVSVLEVPNGVALMPRAADASSRGDASSILFVGTLNYLPNEDGLVWFLDRVLPRIRATVSGVSMVVVGHRPTRRIRLHRSPGLELHESPKSLVPFYRRAAVSVAPLRAGSGSRHKILEALAYGVPVVSTRIGAEGLALEAGSHYACADSPEEFASAVVAALTDPSQATAQARRALPVILERYSWDGIGRRASAALAALARSRRPAAFSGSASEARAG
jgi:glycosyltransferase involved in cell wall biosynthesis